MPPRYAAAILAMGFLSPSADAFSSTIRPATAVPTRLGVISIREPSLAPSPAEEPPKIERIPFDMSGIAMSGLNGKALNILASDYPSQGEVRASIPNECFKVDTVKSLQYLAVSVVGTALCTAAGIGALDYVSPDNMLGNPLTLLFWSAYATVTGTVAMGNWVLAHECGHGAFSKDLRIQDTVGFIIHSIFWVPYYSWQRSHAVHHRYTNHMELGETHVPENGTGSPPESALQKRKKMIDDWGEDTGLSAWGALQAFLHLVAGWPAYLAIGATGGPARGVTNHYWPDPLTPPIEKKYELFPGKWKEKVLKSDVGIATVIGAVTAWGVCNGIGQVNALYFGPLLVVNAWLVIYTWLQHTDVDVPHFGMDDHTFVRGALHSIDRPYDKLDPWGIIDFLHHKIGTTHVVHHFDSSIPHYNAEVATVAVKAKYPELYLYDPTPIPEALWRVCKGCTVVEQRGDRYVWNNKGLEDKIQVDPSLLREESEMGP